jgi:peptidoglycan/xylan/chitin deacetylase (PgdA/CDA1 family)
VAALALAVSGSALGVVLTGLASVLGTGWPLFGRLRRPPFHYLRLGRATLALDRSLLLTAGLLAAVLPAASLALATLFGLTLALTRRPPVAAAVAALALAPLLWRLTGYDLWALFGAAVAVIAVYREIPYLLRVPGTPRRRSRRSALLARLAFLTGAATVLALVFLNRWVYRGFGVQPDVLRHGNPALPYLALTFDDGPDPRFTPEVLRILAKEQVPATFFLVGAHAERYPDLVRRIQADGHEIGSHTYSHRSLFLLPAAATALEVDRAEAVLVRLTGERPHLFRPPRGLFDLRLRRLLAAHRCTVVLWSVSSRDWAEVSPRLIASNVLGPARGGDIVLFHDSGAIFASAGGDRRHMLQALPYVIRRLKAEGFQFVTVGRLQLIAGLTTGGAKP